MATTAKLKPSANRAYSDAIVSAANEDLGLRDTSNGLDLDMQAMRTSMEALEDNFPDNMNPRLRFSLLSQELTETIQGAANSFRDEGEPPVNVSRSHEVNATKAAFDAMSEDGDTAFINFYDNTAFNDQFFANAGMDNNLKDSLASGLDSLSEGSRQFVLGELEGSDNLNSYDDVIAKVNTSLGRFDDIFNNNSNRQKIDSVSTFNDVLPTKTALVDQEIASRMNVKPNSDFFTHGMSVVESARRQVSLTDTPSGLDLDMNGLLARTRALEDKLPEQTDPRLSLALMTQELSETIKTTASNLASDNGDDIRFAEVPPQYKGAEIAATKNSFQYLAEKRDAYLSLPDNIYDPKSFFRNSDVEAPYRRSLLAGIDALDEGSKQYVLGELASNAELNDYADINAQITKSLGHFDATFNNISDRPAINSLAAFQNNLTLEPPMPTPNNDEVPSVPTEAANNSPAALSADGELIIKAINDNKLNSVLGLDNETVRNGLLAAEKKMPIVGDRLHLGMLHQELGNMASAFAKPDQDLKTPLFKVARDSYNNSPVNEEGFISFVGKTRPTDNHPMSEMISSAERDLILEGLKPLTQSEKQYVGANLLDEPAADFNETIALVDRSLRDFDELSKKVNPDNGVDPISVFREALDNAQQAAAQAQNNPTSSQQQQQQQQQQQPSGMDDMPPPPDYGDLSLADDAYSGMPDQDDLNEQYLSSLEGNSNNANNNNNNNNNNNANNNNAKKAAQNQAAPAAQSVAEISAAIAAGDSSPAPAVDGTTPAAVVDETPANTASNDDTTNDNDEKAKKKKAAAKSSPSAEAAAKIAAAAIPAATTVTANNEVPAVDPRLARTEVDILMKALDDNEFFSNAPVDMGEIESRMLAVSEKLDAVKPPDSLRVAVLHQEMKLVGDDLLKVINATPTVDGTKPLLHDKHINASNMRRALVSVAQQHYNDSHRVDNFESPSPKVAFAGMTEAEVDVLHQSVSRLPTGVRQHAMSELKENLSKLPEHGFNDIVSSIKQSLHDFDSVYKGVNPNAKPQMKSFASLLDSTVKDNNKKSDTPIAIPNFTPKEAPTLPAVDATADTANANTDTTPDDKLTNDKNKGNKDKNPEKDPRLENDPNNPNQGGGTQTKVTYSLFNFNKPTYLETMRDLQFKQQVALAAKAEKDEAKAIKKEAKKEVRQAKLEQKAEQLAQRLVESALDFADRDNAANPPAPSPSSDTEATLNPDGTVTPPLTRREEVDSLANFLSSEYEGSELVIDDPELDNDEPAPVVDPLDLSTVAAATAAATAAANTESTPDTPENENEAPVVADVDSPAVDTRDSEVVATVDPALDSPVENTDATVDIEAPTNEVNPSVEAPKATDDTADVVAPVVAAPTDEATATVDIEAPTVDVPAPVNEKPKATDDIAPAVDAPVVGTPATNTPTHDAHEKEHGTKTPAAYPPPKPSIPLDTAPNPDFNDSLVDNYYKGIQADYTDLQTQMDAENITIADKEMLRDKSEAFLYQVGALSEHLDDLSPNANAEELEARSDGLDFVRTLKDDIEERAEKKGLFAGDSLVYNPLEDENNRGTHPLKEKFNEAEEQIKATKEGMEKQASGLMAGLGAKLGGLFGRKP